MGLLPPQKEVVKAAVKVYAMGERGVICRASTGTGKTWVARGLVEVLKPRRTILLTEPHLVPQMVQEFEAAPFAVHAIDSWERLKELAAKPPEGLYLLSYSRFRQHPDYERRLLERKTFVVNEAGERAFRSAGCCPACMQPIAEELVPRKSEKGKCPGCGSPLYTYVSENEKPKDVSYGRWIRSIESGAVSQVRSHNHQLPYLRHLKRIGFDLLIADEAHNCANGLSNQGSALIRLASGIPRVLALTATVTNGMAKSWYNLLWGVCPAKMKADGWDRRSATRWQAAYGAFREVHKTDAKNRHRSGERVTTSDVAGISPAVLGYVLPNLVTMESDDFDDLPPVEREVIRCAPHPLVDESERAILKILEDTHLPHEERLVLAAVRAAALLRVPDTFCHADDPLTLRGEVLGTLHRAAIGEELLEKEQRLVELVQQAAERGERTLVYLDCTQKIDLRPVVAGILRRHAGVSVDVLSNAVKPGEVVRWFQETRGQVVVTGYKRAGTGLNLPQFPNVCWFQYTANSRLAEQGEGRVRRVNTADVHRRLFGEVRPVHYSYLVCGRVQELLLSYTLEKRATAKLSEGETPDIDPGECANGDRSFSGLLTRALREGRFEYTDPSILLKRMTRAENERVRAENRVCEAPAVSPRIAAEKPRPLPARPSPGGFAKKTQLSLF